MNFTPNFSGIVNALKYIIENGIPGSGGSGGGGSGGATSQKQDEQTTRLTNLEADVEEIRANFFSNNNLITGRLGNIAASIGNRGAAPATSDTGDFSIDSFFQRLLQRITFFTTLFMPSATETEYIGTSAGANLKSSAGNIYAITVSNNNNNIRYFQVFNKNSNPQFNDVPARVFPIPGSDSLLLIGQDIIGGNGITLSVGVTWGFSTTRLTYTAGSATDAIVTIRWA